MTSAPVPARSAVEIRDLVVRYGTLTAVDGISLDAGAGRITALLGPNGAGKTSTVETAEGLRRPSAGSVRILGHDPVAERAAVVSRIGVMLQEGGIPNAVRPREAIEQYAGFYPDPLPPAELLERVGLAGQASSSFRSLSGGERQRLSLALAIVGRPTVAFLDEPTSGIDPAGRRLIREIVRELRDEGVAVVLTTHDLEEAERLADDVVIVDRGRVVATGTPDELMRAEGAGLAFSAEPGLDLDDLRSTVGAPVAEVQPGEYRVDTEGTPAVVAALTAWLAERGLALGDLRAGRHRLEDVFLRLVDERPEP